MKILVNKDYGGFSVSKEVYDYLGIPWDGYGFLRDKHFGMENEENGELYRSHPKLIEAVECIGIEKSNGYLSKLEIIEIPDDVKDWKMKKYDGWETIHEKHRSW